MASGNGKLGTPAELPPRQRDRHRDWLLEITQIPTAAGREWRVVNWIRAWVAARPELNIAEDRAGNLVVQPRRTWGGGGGRSKAAAPIFITAHLDHPAFVVHRIIGPGTVELAFRGGVNDDYFIDARVTIHAGGPDLRSRPERRFAATLAGEGAGVLGDGGERLFKTYLAEIDDDGGEGGGDEPEVMIGDVATWELPPAVIDGAGIVHTHACDDLSAVAAALSAYDTLLAGVRAGMKVLDVRLLFTRSEEIGFTGAIAACKLKTMPKGSRVIALENSRSFADSPIGGGPIVRVGDRLSVFSPMLTAACGKRAEQLAGKAAAPTATQKSAEFATGMKWQRKLMAGGACEATVYCAYGYEATCLCLPLGNYHNMAHLQEVQDGSYDVGRLGPPRVACEQNSIADYHGLVDLLVGIGVDLPHVDPIGERIEKLYVKHAFVLEEGRAVSGEPERGGTKRRGVQAKAGGKEPRAKRASGKAGSVGDKPSPRKRAGVKK